MRWKATWKGQACFAGRQYILHPLESCNQELLPSHRVLQTILFPYKASEVQAKVAYALHTWKHTDSLRCQQLRPRHKEKGNQEFQRLWLCWCHRTRDPAYCFLNDRNRNALISEWTMSTIFLLSNSSSSQSYSHPRTAIDLSAAANQDCISGQIGR